MPALYDPYDPFGSPSSSRAPVARPDFTIPGSERPTVGNTPKMTADSVPRGQRVMTGQGFSMPGGEGKIPTAPPMSVPGDVRAVDPPKWYGAGKNAARTLRKVVPALGKATGLGGALGSGLGDYQLLDPDVDSSALGTFKALKDGDFAGAGRSLSKGAVEAVMDVGSGIAKTADFFLPGQPVSKAYDGLLRSKFGSQLITPDTQHYEPVKETPLVKSAPAENTPSLRLPDIPAPRDYTNVVRSMAPAEIDRLLSRPAQQTRGVDGALRAARDLTNRGYVVTHSTLRALINNETSQRGQDINESTQQRGQDLTTRTTLRGQDMDLQGRILPKQMELEQAAQMRGLRASIYKQAGGDPIVAASLAQSYGLDGKEFLEAGEAKSKLSDAGTKAADKRFESMAITADKDGRPVVDPAAQAAMRSVRNQVAPGYDNMGPEAQARYDKEIRASQELIQGLNARKDTGWLQKLGIDNPTDALGQLPDLRGGSAPETVGWLDGLMTPNVERGDTRLRDASGREYYVPQKTMNEGTRSLINRLRKE